MEVTQLLLKTFTMIKLMELGSCCKQAWLTHTHTQQRLLLSKAASIVSRFKQETQSAIVHSQVLYKCLQLNCQINLRMLLLLLLVTVLQFHGKLTTVDLL